MDGDSAQFATKVSPEKLTAAEAEVGYRDKLRGRLPFDRLMDHYGSC